MKTVWHSDGDGWTREGPKITTPDRLGVIKTVLDHRPVIVEHWIYRGSRAPDRLVFDDFEAFSEWLGTTAAGDIINVWDYGLCRVDNMLASGKCPDEKGEVPLRGAY